MSNKRTEARIGVWPPNCCVSGVLRQLLSLGSRRNLAELGRAPPDVRGRRVSRAHPRGALGDALVQIEKRELIFEQWGLGERHETGPRARLSFRRACPGPERLSVRRPSPARCANPCSKVCLQRDRSAWAGETGKNIVSVFRELPRPTRSSSSTRPTRSRAGDSPAPLTDTRERPTRR